jgi:osmotically-inducible protein OsmY
MNPSNDQGGAIVVSHAPTARCAAIANASLPDCDSVAEAARQRLQASGYFAVRGLSCEHHEGVLVLRGQVSSWHQKQLAQKSVRCLCGVAEIINAVVVSAPSQSERRLSNFTDGFDAIPIAEQMALQKQGDEAC